MTKLIIPIAFALLITLVSASNTIFIRTGIPSNTLWKVYVSQTGQASPYNQNFNVIISGTSNSLSTNALSSGLLPQAYLYVAGYSIGGVYTYNYGFVNVDSNIYHINIVNFTPSSNNLNPIYASCNHNQSTCSPVTGTLGVNTSTLQNHVIGPPYSANLTVYINPAGYYEYIVQNESLGDNPATKISQNLYVNIQPGQLISNQINLTFLGKQYTLGAVAKNTSAIKNSTYQGAILYSGLIDISPIEYAMLGGNLTPQNFANFVYTNDASFYNTTLIYNIGLPSTCSANYNLGEVITSFTCQLEASAGSLLQSDVNTGLSTLSILGHAGILPLGLVLNGAKLTGLTNLNDAETQAPITQSIPILLNNIPNSTLSYPMYVSYAYPNALCQLGELNPTGICIQSGQKGMLAFNNYIDDTYAPQIETNQFLTINAVAILGFALVMLIVKKINGE